MKYLKEFSRNAEYEAYINGNPDLPNVSLIDEGDSVKYKQKPDYSKQYLTIVAVERGALRFYKQGTGNDIQYSLDGGETWTTLRSGQFGTAVDAGHKILIKAELTPTYSYGIGSIDFGLSDAKHCKYYIEGNVMSLLYGDNFVGQTSLAEKPNSFVKLFNEGNYHILTSAENLVLPATTLSNRCYYNMFKGCTLLTTAPELPATTLASDCYQVMFEGCSSLTSAPQLPATTLVSGCYNGMFFGCTSLIAAPELPALTLTENCYRDMFNGCTSLVTAPELPATTLARQCYYQLFKGCTNLSYIKMLATKTSAVDCLKDWVQGVAANGTFVKAASANLPTGASGIPSGWEVINA